MESGILTPIYRPLTDPTLAMTAEQRQLLKYLIGCALPTGTVLYADVAEKRYTFAGAIGLTPAWTERALNEREQRWVSACMLARTNAFGQSVQISMRGPLATVATATALDTSEQEQRDYAIFEGGFFGNLFAEQPVAYVCSGKRTAAQQNDPILASRVCTIPSNEKTALGAPLTRCGFIHIGACEQSTSFTVDGAVYTEVIFTYLKPAGVTASGK